MPVQLAAFATGVPPNICAFHCYTRNSANLSRILAVQFQKQFLG
jgi:hypothetical protein